MELSKNGYKAKSNVTSSDVEGSEIEVARSAEGNYTLVLPALSFAKNEFQIVRNKDNGKQAH